MNPNKSNDGNLQRDVHPSETLQRDFDKHLLSYPLKLRFDPTGLVSGSNRSLRTDPNFVKLKVLESGLDVETKANNALITRSAPSSKVIPSLNDIVNELMDTGCYDGVEVIIGKKYTGEGSASISKDNTSTTRQVHIMLQEKKWHQLYIGGGMKRHSSGIGMSGGNIGVDDLSKIQFETKGSLLNLTGHCDITTAEYTIDQAGTPTLAFSHARPLHSLFSQDTKSLLRRSILSNLGCSVYAQVDNIDHEDVRSSKDRIQCVGMRLSNTVKGAAKVSAMSLGDGKKERIYAGLDWSMSYRDLLPRRSINRSYVMDASPEILLTAGPSLKHSLVGEVKLNGKFLDDRFNPTVGVDSYGGFELAGPPGTTGFFKLWGGGSFHTTIQESICRGEEPRHWIYNIAFHSTFHSGIVKPLRYGGLCCNGKNNTTSVHDRFYIGGPNQLRGFLPSGIGPRAQTGGASTPGDAVGGDVFYTSTLALSLPFPGTNLLSQYGLRLFGFMNSGTSTGLNDTLTINRFINSSRVSVGCGASMRTPVGRLEATYSIPLRYSDKDARAPLQLGFGLNFG